MRSPPKKLVLRPPLESEILPAVLAALTFHPAVAWAHRFNTASFSVEEEGRKPRWIKFAFCGCADILGQLKDGRFLAVECKRAGEKPTPNQRAFLDRVNQHGGLAFLAFSADDVVRELGGKP